MTKTVLKKKSPQDFRSWNETMVEKHNPEAYHLHSHAAIRFVERMRVASILRAVNGGRGSAVLEVGCGAGNVLEGIRHAKLIGVDLSNRMVKRAKERLASKPFIAIQADAEFLPFQTSFFDAVICTEVIEHVQDPDRTLEEIWRVARPSARIAISLPNERLINRVKDFFIRWGLAPFLFRGRYNVPERMNEEWHLHVFRLKDFLAKLSTRFLVERVTSIPSSFLPLRYVIACKPRKDENI